MGLLLHWEALAERLGQIWVDLCLFRPRARGSSRGPMRVPLGWLAALWARLLPKLPLGLILLLLLFPLPPLLVPQRNSREVQYCAPACECSQPRPCMQGLQGGAQGKVWPGRRGEGARTCGCHGGCGAGERAAAVLRAQEERGARSCCDPSTGERGPGAAGESPVFWAVGSGCPVPGLLRSVGA